MSKEDVAAEKRREHDRQDRIGAEAREVYPPEDTEQDDVDDDNDNVVCTHCYQKQHLKHTLPVFSESL